MKLFLSTIVVESMELVEIQSILKLWGWVFKNFESRKVIWLSKLAVQVQHKSIEPTYKQMHTKQKHTRDNVGTNSKMTRKGIWELFIYLVRHEIILARGWHQNWRFLTGENVLWWGCDVLYCPTVTRKISHIHDWKQAQPGTGGLSSASLMRIGFAKWLFWQRGDLWMPP